MITALSKELLLDVNKANEPFQVIGRIVPNYQNDEWSYFEELFPEPCEKYYYDDDEDWNEYIENPEKIIYLAYENERCVGQIILRRDWNLYAFIEDISVAASARGNGIGTALIQQAITWAKQHELKGLALETQDNNVLACRFYAKCGMKIGAVNTMLYRNFCKPWSDEIAVFWYMKFEGNEIGG